MAGCCNIKCKPLRNPSPWLLIKAIVMQVKPTGPYLMKKMWAVKNHICYHMLVLGQSESKQLPVPVRELTSAPVSASYMLAVLSHDALTTWVPPTNQSAAITAPVWPSSSSIGWRTNNASWCFSSDELAPVTVIIYLLRSKRTSSNQQQIIRVHCLYKAIRYDTKCLLCNEKQMDS